MVPKSTPEPLPAPAPAIVCASSTNNIQLPFCSKANIISLIFSSNSPLYLEPANRLPISNDHSSCPFKNLGSFSETNFCANPSAMAVLPTPGSPTNKQLALNFLANTFIIVSNSISRPIMGSNLSLRAISVKFTQCSFNISSHCDFDITCES